MKSQITNLVKKFSAGLLIWYFLTFLLFYITNYLSDSLTLAYVWMFAEKITELLPLLVTATVTLTLYCAASKKAAYLALIPFSAVRVVYFLPYFYLQFIFDGYDSVESLLFGALSALGEATIAYAFTLLIFGVMLLVVKKANRGRASLEDIIFKKTTLDFKNPLSLAFAIVSLLGFSYYFIYEIIDTVVILISYSGTLTLGEIAYMFFAYLFDIALIFAYYFAISSTKNLIIASEE